MGGAAVDAYVDTWITEIRDVTDQARRIRELVAVGQLDAAAGALPVERPYPLSAEMSAVIG
ncbi:DUF4291 family protein [Nocardia sp. CA-129566]|uniref:DUF4291 family protein n=1 Tax=Nocardia sp. CA-129566 TaxID=3239976 RepID=UPI003D99BE86